MSAPALTAERRAALNRRSLRLAYATAGYNLLEGVVALAAGAASSSSALLGFGLDSFIEVSSAAVVIWQFRSRLPEARERLALRLIAVSFFALAAWVGLAAVRSLSGGGEAGPSAAGVALAAVSVVVMPLLMRAKRRTGRELGSATVVADSTQTLLCAYLSAVLLAGLVLNAAFGWSWADPIAALVIAAVAIREGLQAWKGEQCDDCAPPAGDVRAGGCGCGPDCADACCRSETVSEMLKETKQ
ncbi:cation transporter [Planomonospora sp. ID67723]|uniref:cation transporter n=1 Tax=Planomonospora sp. ID67723 TaxID=2738134 RepID=UPI0018C35D61|nr:cation transporter [Planomonospora sp. ID67723]MBG0832009.1 cation transporter [Planomonospora sp. ID67723]